MSTMTSLSATIPPSLRLAQAVGIMTSAFLSGMFNHSESIESSRGSHIHISRRGRPCRVIRFRPLHVPSPKHPPRPRMENHIQPGSSCSACSRNSLHIKLRLAQLQSLLHSQPPQSGNLRSRRTRHRQHRAFHHHLHDKRQWEALPQSPGLETLESDGGNGRKQRQEGRKIAGTACLVGDHELHQGIAAPGWGQPRHLRQLLYDVLRIPGRDVTEETFKLVRTHFLHPAGFQSCTWDWMT